MKDPKYVAPTFPLAIRLLSGDTKRGFTFVHADGTERFYPFSELCEVVERRAGQLYAQGLKKGDRVGLLIPDPEQFILSFLGSIMGGIVPVPMYPALSFKNVATYHDTVTHITKAAGASLLLTTEATKQFVDPVKPRVETLRDIVTVEALTSVDHGTVDVDVEPDDLAFLQFTSGSTSRPKGVTVTNRNLAWNSECFMIHGLDCSNEDVGVTWLPLFHDMGLIGYGIGTIFGNINSVFIPTASFIRNPSIWLQKIHQHRGTIAYAPNFAYALVNKRLKDKDVAELDLSCIRHAGCGAEPIHAKTLREFAQKLAPAKFPPKCFLPSYGMAEATLAITFVPGGTGVVSDTVDKKGLEQGKATEAAAGAEGSQELVNCGRPFPGHEIAIVDEQGNVLGDRQVGQIITRGPSISSGYYMEPELTNESFKPGPGGHTWLYTGDLGYMVEGSVFICGRLKDMIIVRGRNFYPNDIEWVVSELPGVRRGNVVAFGIDVEGEEQLVVAAEAFASEAEALKSVIAQAVVADFALTPADVVVVPQGTLPRTSSGKPQRRKTKQMYLDGALARARAVQGRDEQGGDAGASA
ncbi:MAG: fatty acyl-AMP ligase [Labilithrix sp.]|nr:fatty acyl-AMP ligase [Labilithrix sp.]